MNTQTCCFIGHKSLEINEIQKIITNLDYEIENLINQGVTNFISGGIIGFDLIAASLVVSKKEMGRQIRLIFVLPKKETGADWNDRQKALYQNLLQEADKVIYTSKQCNKYMTAHSAHCICALQNEQSRTGYAVKLARKEGLNIINTAG